MNYDKRDQYVLIENHTGFFLDQQDFQCFPWLKRVYFWPKLGDVFALQNMKMKLIYIYPWYQISYQQYQNQINFYWEKCHIWRTSPRGRTSWRKFCWNSLLFCWSFGWWKWEWMLWFCRNDIWYQWERYIRFRIRFWSANTSPNLGQKDTLFCRGKHWKSCRSKKNLVWISKSRYCALLPWWFTDETCYLMIGSVTMS